MPHRGQRRGGLLVALVVAAALRTCGVFQAFAPAPLAGGSRGLQERAPRRVAMKFFDKIFGDPEGDAKRKLQKLATGPDQEVQGNLISLKSTCKTLAQSVVKVQEQLESLDKARESALAAAKAGWEEPEDTWDARFTGLSSPLVSISEEIEASITQIEGLDVTVANLCEAVDTAVAARKAKVRSIVKNLDDEARKRLQEQVSVAIGDEKALSAALAESASEASRAAVEIKAVAMSKYVDQVKLIKDLREARSESKKIETEKIAKAKAEREAMEKAEEEAREMAKKEAEEAAAAKKAEEEANSAALTAALVLALLAGGAYYFSGGDPSAIKQAMQSGDFSSLKGLQAAGEAAKAAGQATQAAGEAAKAAGEAAGK